MKTKTITCVCCGDTIEKNDIRETVDGHVCYSCFIHLYDLCPACNRYLKTDDLIYPYDDGGNICQECIEDMSYCDHCEQYTVNGVDQVDGAEYWCGRCINSDAYTCNMCGDIITQVEEVDGEVVCEYCLGEYYTYCNSCGNYYSIDEPYCTFCGPESGICHAYNYRPEPRFFGGESNEYFGFELELEDVDPETVFNYMEEKEVYLKEDGSLCDGFEIVSHPMTREYLKKRDLFAAIKNLRSHGATSHSNGRCGFHIHVSRTAFTPLQIYKILRFVVDEKHRRFIMRLTQRTNSQVQDYCSFEYSRLLSSISKDKYYGHRYTTINLQNEKTIEFRMFRGNTKPERLW